jgi:hypothetical protein
MAGGILGGKKMSPEQRGQIESADAMKNTKFTTPHGSQGVTNSNYADYVRQNPDLMANYNLHWKKDAPEPLSQNNAGISLEEFGAMHWNSSGRNEGRSMPGVSSGGGESAPLAAPTIASPIQEAAESNIYFPMRVPEYTTPQALDYSAFTSSSPFGGDGGLLYQPGTQQYRDAYPIADNILSYQPPQLGLPQVTYSNPLALELIEYGLHGGGEESSKSEDDDSDDADERQYGGGDGGGANNGYGGNASGADVGNSGMGGYGGTGPASKGGSGKGKAGQSDHY